MLIVQFQMNDIIKHVEIFFDTLLKIIRKTVCMHIFQA